VGTQGRSGQVRKISPPPGFDHRTVQPVASRYTEYALRATQDEINYEKMIPNPVTISNFGLGAVSRAHLFWFDF